MTKLAPPNDNLNLNSGMSYTAKATISTAVLWIAPFIYVAIAMGDYNCSATCECLTECFPNIANSSYDPTCSRVFPPMKNIWLLFTVISWVIGLVFIFFYLKRFVWSVFNIFAANYEMFRSSTEVFNIQRQLHLFSGSVKHQSARETPESHSPEKIRDSLESEEPQINSTEEDVGSRNSSITMKRLGIRFKVGKMVTYHMKYILWLYITYLTMTAPSMILFMIDIIKPGHVLNMITINFCLCCPFIYCYLCPFILVRCLPGVKSSLSDLCFSLYTKTSRWRIAQNCKKTFYLFYKVLSSLLASRGLPLLLVLLYYFLLYANVHLLKYFELLSLVYLTK